MHPDHTGGEGVPAGEAAPAHDGDGHRGVQLFRKLLKFLVGPPPDHPAAADEHGLFRLGDHIHQGVDIPDVGLGGLQIMAGGQGAQTAALPVLRPGDELVVDLHTGEGDVFQKVDHHRPGPPGGRHGEGLAHYVGDGLGVPHQIGGLGDGHGDAGDVHLLEGVLAQGLLGHVAGDEDDGGGVHVGGGDAGNQVCRSRAAGGKAHPHLPGGPGVAVGGVGGPLLVGREDVVDFVLVVVQLVIEVQDGPAGIPKDGVHLLLQQALHDGRGCSDFQTLSLLVVKRSRKPP